MGFEAVLSGNTTMMRKMVDDDREMFDLVIGVLFHYDP